MDKLDTIQKQKKFFKVVYGDLVGEGNNLKENTYIRLYQAKDDFSKVEFFNNIDDLVGYTCNKRYGINTYFSLSTTNGDSGQEKDLLHRTVIAFDFDKKDFDKLDSKDIMYKFKELGLWYHCLVDSGNGYHAYMCIEPTQDIQKVIDITKAIGNKIGADTNAMKSTQVLRVPYTFNIKNNKSKQVNIITQFNKSTIKRYNIDKLYNRFCNAKYNNSIGDKATTHIINNSNLKHCIVDILENGSAEGNRNHDLQKIVVTLRRLNKNIKEIQYTCKEWNNKSQKQLSEHELEYQVNYIFENVEKCSYECKGCKYANECWGKIESDFEYSEDEELISIEYKVAKKLSVKGVNNMSGSELLVFNVLKHLDRELNIDDIVKHLTYKNKCRLSLKTIREVLKTLEDKGFIIKNKGVRKLSIKDSYTINPIRCDIEKTFDTSYFPTLICIYGIITPSELKLYHHMRYKHDLMVKQGKAQGNIFRINQTELAKDLGYKNDNNAKISEMINGLIESKILEIWDIKKNENGFDYYTYRLVK